MRPEADLLVLSAIALSIGSLGGAFCPACYQWKRTHSDLPPLHPKVSFSSIQISVLEGSLLGDGCLYQHTPRNNPHLIVSRKRADKSYLEWQANVFQELLRPRGVFDYQTYDQRTKKTYLGNGFESRSLPELLPWRQRWYPEGKKRVPRDLAFDSLMLAVWFADDGSIMPVSPTSPSRLQLKFATHGFPEEDVRFLAQMLSDRYGRSFRVHPDNGNW